MSLAGLQMSIMPDQLTTNFQHCKVGECTNANPSPIKEEGYEALQGQVTKELCRRAASQLP